MAPAVAPDLGQSFTLRPTHQNDAKKAGLPWTAAKGYDTFCPVGKFIPASALADPQSVRLWLKVNNVIRQDGNTSDMMFKCVHTGKTRARPCAHTPMPTRPHAHARCD